MKQWKRILSFLLLNVLVSACTMLAVLYGWDRMRGATPGLGLQFPVNFSGGQAAPLTPSNTPLPQPTPTRVFLVYQVVSGDTFESLAARFGISVEELVAENGFTQSQTLGAGEVLRIPATPAPQPDPEVQIKDVIGAGDLGSERVVIEQVGAGELSLSGWQMVDRRNNVLFFPDLVLTKDGFQVSIFTRSGTNSANTIYWGLTNAVWQSGDTVTLRDTQGDVRATYTIP